MENFARAVRAISSERGLDLAWRREVVKTTSFRALLSVTGTGKEGFNGNWNQQNSASTIEREKVEIGAEICSGSLGSLRRVSNGY
jgi:hypothetical protein